MSLEFNVYVNHIDDSIIPKWIALMNQRDMRCEIHPDFSFENHSGFLPFKIELINPKNPILKNKEFLTGFEFYLDNFNFDIDINPQVPENNILKKIFRKPKKEAACIGKEGIVEKLKDCNKVLTFTWGSVDTFELRMASLSTAIIVMITNGVCCYPNDNLWYDSETIYDDFYKEVIEYEDSLNPEDWRTHPFEAWQ